MPLPLTTIEQEALDRAAQDFQHWNGVVQWQTGQYETAKAAAVAEPGSAAAAANVERAGRWLTHARAERYRCEGRLDDLKRLHGLPTDGES